MNRDWVQDIHDMHEKYGVHEWVKNNPEKLKEYLDFRLKFIFEEYNETSLAVNGRDPEEIVDGLIDICVVAIGTLDAFGVDANKAWTEVHRANMAKTVGVKESRPNPLGLPDLVKPAGWVSPDHEGNHGLLSDSL
jgi:hypothetical protein